MADENRPFVIDVKRRWTLFILPTIAILYFIAVLILIIGNYRIQGVSTDLLALTGVGFFVLVMLIELPFFMRRSAPRRPRPARAPTAPAPVAAASPGPTDDEYLLTDEEQQGMRVLEYSKPAKSHNSNIVYTKTYVPVSSANVLRIETAVADGADL